MQNFRDYLIDNLILEGDTTAAYDMEKVIVAAAGGPKFKSSLIKNSDKVIGNRTRVKVVKNKVAPPFQQAEFDIMYGEGISITGEIIDLGVELNIINKSGSWYSYGDTKLGQGRDAVKEILVDNIELLEELENKITEQLNN